MGFNMKPFFAGVLVTSLVSTGNVAFAESSQTIQAVFGKVKFVVDDMPIDQKTLLYNGTTYISLRSAAEILDKEVVWDEATNTAYLKARLTGNSEPAADSDIKAVNSEESNKEETNSAERNKEEPKPEEVKEAKEEKKQQELPFRLGEIEYELYNYGMPSYAPDNPTDISLGPSSTTFRHFYANRTKYIIKSISQKVFDTSSRTEQIFSIYQYVMPNTFSDTFNAMISFNSPPSTQRPGQKEDLEWWETTVKFLNAKGEEVTLKYDYRKDTYTITGDWKN